MTFITTDKGTTKFCPACGEQRPISKFDLDLDGLTDDSPEWDGYLPLCKPCVNLYPYGYPEMPEPNVIRSLFTHQGGVCYSCHKPLAGYFYIRPFVGMGKNGVSIFKLCCADCKQNGDLKPMWVRYESQQPYNPLIDGM